MFTYLACPYTDPDPAIRQERMELATMATAFLIDRGEVVYSPITHGHHIHPHLLTAKKDESEFWMAQCLPMVSAAHLLFILELPGWEKSQGIDQELKMAQLVDIPVVFSGKVNKETLLEVMMRNVAQVRWQKFGISGAEGTFITELNVRPG